MKKKKKKPKEKKTKNKCLRKKELKSFTFVHEL